MRNDTPVATSQSTPALFIGKWTVRVMYALEPGPQRHAELRRSLQGVSQRMLTKTLRNLESNGLIIRRITNSKPLAVEYALSKAGRAFLTPLSSVCHWAERHGKKLAASIRLAELELREELGP
jgi:DNA-binding HxlR family transcriptional regulator